MSENGELGFEEKMNIIVRTITVLQQNVMTLANSIKASQDRKKELRSGIDDFQKSLMASFREAARQNIIASKKPRVDGRTENAFGSEAVEVGNTEAYVTSYKKGKRDDQNFLHTCDDVDARMGGFSPVPNKGKGEQMWDVKKSAKYGDADRFLEDIATGRLTSRDVQEYFLGLAKRKGAK